MNPDKYIRNAFVAATAALFVGTTVLPAREPSDPIDGASVDAVATAPTATGEVAATTKAALAALGSAAPRVMTLATAFRSYFAFKGAHRSGQETVPLLVTTACPARRRAATCSI
jgi:hypothetical protein